MSEKSLFEEAEPVPEVVEDGVTQARKHLCQAANLYNLCVKCVDKLVAPNVPPIAQTSEMFQAAVTDLFRETTKWGFVEKMPNKPLQQ
jgi:hypothetical protein